MKKLVMIVALIGGSTGLMLGMQKGTTLSCEEVMMQCIKKMYPSSPAPPKISPPMTYEEGSLGALTEEIKGLASGMQKDLYKLNTLQRNIKDPAHQKSREENIANEAIVLTEMEEKLTGLQRVLDKGRTKLANIAQEAERR